MDKKPTAEDIKRWIEGQPDIMQDMITANRIAKSGGMPAMCSGCRRTVEVGKPCPRCKR